MPKQPCSAQFHQPPICRLSDSITCLSACIVRAWTGLDRKVVVVVEAVIETALCYPLVSSLTRLPPPTLILTKTTNTSQEPKHWLPLVFKSRQRQASVATEAFRILLHLHLSPYSVRVCIISSCVCVPYVKVDGIADPDITATPRLDTCCLGSFLSSLHDNSPTIDWTRPPFFIGNPQYHLH
jgi:hypothetical protein